MKRGNVNSPSPKAMQRAVHGVPLDQVGNNPPVHSKGVKRYGVDGSKGPQDSTGNSPSKPLGSPYTSPAVRHVAPQAPKEPTRVGFVDGKLVTPKYGK